MRNLRSTRLVSTFFSKLLHNQMFHTIHIIIVKKYWLVADRSYIVAPYVNCIGWSRPEGVVVRQATVHDSRRRRYWSEALHRSIIQWSLFQCYVRQVIHSMVTDVVWLTILTPSCRVCPPISRSEATWHSLDSRRLWRMFTGIAFTNFMTEPFELSRIHTLKQLADQTNSFAKSVLCYR